MAKLNPEYIISKTGETFNISLEVDDIPNCGGFETIITYNKSILNLTAITLSNVSNNANLRMINTSSGLISLVWFSNLPNNNFKVATLTFKALNSGNGNISLQKTTICDSNGTKYSNIITKVTNYCIISRTTIHLKKGWNAISLPHRNNITFDNPSNVVEIITYYNNSWKLNRENNLKVLYGYYIFCKNDTIMNILYNSNSEPSNPPSRIVYPGYNLVGVNPAINDYENYNGKVKLSDYILSINNTWIQILDLDGRIYTRNDNISNVYLEPYKIYWLGMSKKDTLLGRNVN
ncbi:cohesin domain-containing protein [Methanothermococcus okinawensis]|uniref:Cohesin domain-containing protein n=1 Tax=Methanothermococcus okinawensis (strain DSM 14208 / JCM 11175 / IH1) TaxID=647113 RepID=F8AKW1_METOI|nr:cohesin domain-containing protein [Methanothermococcus okinawensis]AEH07583.1 hypothetical protein Metok_1621 [Methanothermococcus okinawensis IH1]